MAAESDVVHEETAFVMQQVHWPKGLRLARLMLQDQQKTDEPEGARIARRGCDA